MKIKVEKRDGSLEDYDEDHVIKVAVACGLSQDQAEALAANITKWTKDNSLSKVTSLQIRDQFLLDLKKVNAAAADLYLWYVDSKEGKP